MVFKNIPVFVLGMKVASALEGLKHNRKITKQKSLARTITAIFAWIYVFDLTNQNNL